MPDVGGYVFDDTANNYEPPAGSEGDYSFEGSDNSQNPCLCPDDGQHTGDIPVTGAAEADNG